jgi:NADH-quinone oxidoreductase subunit K
MSPALPDQALLLASALFVVGLLGVIVRRNVLFMLVGVEVMLNAAGLAFVAAAARHGQPDGQVMFLFVLAVAAAEVAVGLALVLRLRKQRGSLDPDIMGAERDAHEEA